MTDARTAEATRAGVDGFELRLPHGGDRLRLGGRRRTLVMGVLNVTPDSFSDGGRYLDSAAAIAQAEEMAAQGADVIDVGAESTRPGAAPVPVEEQLRRLMPVLSGLAPRMKIPISVDTVSAEVARKALDAGAQIVNDVSALRGDAEMGPLLAASGAPVILMHMLGRPREMQVNPTYSEVVSDILSFLRERIDAAADHGIARDQIMVDPGFGFGKTLEHNLALLRRLSEFRVLDRPILVGTSRKSMLGAILDVPARERLHGTSATTAAAVERGAAMVRVHDVGPAVHVVKVLAAILGRAWN